MIPGTNVLSRTRRIIRIIASSHWKLEIVCIRLVSVVPTSGVWSPGTCVQRSLARCAPRRIAELGENPRLLCPARSSATSPLWAQRLRLGRTSWCTWKTKLSNGIRVVINAVYVASALRTLFLLVPNPEISVVCFRFHVT